MSPETLQRRRLAPQLRAVPAGVPAPEIAPRAVADLLVCMGLAAAAAFAALLAPAGLGPVSWVLAGLAVFVAPGYLLLEAAAPSLPGARARAERLALAAGLSPALVGLAALATAAVPGGFRAPVIVLVVALTCGALGAAAIWRRQHREVDARALLARLRAG